MEQPDRRRRKFFRVFLRQKRKICPKIDIRRAQIWPSEKSKIIKARRRRNFLENNKNQTIFLPGFLKIKKTYVKIRSPKILKGGGSYYLYSGSCGMIDQKKLEETYFFIMVKSFSKNIVI